MNATPLLLGCYARLLAVMECTLEEASAEQVALPLWAVDQLAMMALGFYRSVHDLHRHLNGASFGDIPARLLRVLELANALVVALYQTQGECSCGTRVLEMAANHTREWLRD